MWLIFFFSSRRRHTRFDCDWSSDVCSSDLFERFCHDSPELLDEIGLPERVNAGLRLLEASGKPEPWQESARPFWQKPQVTLGLAVGVAILGLALVVAWGATVNKAHRIAALEKQAYERAP